jgi:hypothetical protein
VVTRHQARDVLALRGYLVIGAVLLLVNAIQLGGG